MNIFLKNESSYYVLELAVIAIKLLFFKQQINIINLDGEDILIICTHYIKSDTINYY